MKQGLFIPHLGTQFTLAEDWTFNLFEEHRNDTLIAAADLYKTLPPRAVDDFWQLPLSERDRLWEKSPWRTQEGAVPNGEGRWVSRDLCVPFTLRAGTILKITRIYIRQGQQAFDSVTFFSNCLVSQPGDPLFRKGKAVKSVRFWAKLDDVNKIVFELPTTGL